MKLTPFRTTKKKKKKIIDSHYREGKKSCFFFWGKNYIKKFQDFDFDGLDVFFSNDDLMIIPTTNNMIH